MPLMNNKSVIGTCSKGHRYAGHLLTILFLSVLIFQIGPISTCRLSALKRAWTTIIILKVLLCAASLAISAKTVKSPLEFVTLFTQELLVLRQLVVTAWRSTDGHLARHFFQQQKIPADLDPNPPPPLEEFRPRTPPPPSKNS